MLYCGWSSTLSAIFSLCCKMCIRVLRLRLLNVRFDILVWLVSDFIVVLVSFLHLVLFGVIRRGTIMGQSLVVIVITIVTVNMIFVGSEALLFSVLIHSAFFLRFGFFVLP